VLYDEMIDLARTFMQSRILLSAIELDLFSAVGEGATAPAVAAKLGADTRATETLMNALAALELLAKRDGVYRNEPVAAKYLAQSSPENERAAMMHTVHLWKRWSTLTDCVRAGTAVQKEGAGDRDGTWVRAFIAAMHRNASTRSSQVVEALGAQGVRHLLDIGGGSGAYSIAFAKADPCLLAEILDLPAVLPIAQAYIEEAGLSDRVKTRAGDLRKDRFGEGYDMVFLSAICHMLSPQENKDLFLRAHDALVRGGRIAVQDFLLEPDKTAPPAGAIFALNMLVGTAEGSSYSQEEYSCWLQEAGFEEIRRLRLAGPTGLMVATRK
jgi:3-hydroxy-5-methyl-1-naphthoate 3-O-methyltransferase